MATPQPHRPHPPVTEELVRALPKTDLHCHLDGSLRLSTILELADQNGVELPADTPEGLARAIHMGQRCASLEEYLTAFDITLAVLQSEDALYRAAYELAVDCAAENVRYLEVRYAPVLHTRHGLKPTTIVDAVLLGLRHAARETGIRSNVIICGIRHLDPETSVRLKFYFDFGLRVSINTDSRLITDTTVTKELLLAHREMGFSLDDLCTLLVQGFKSAFLPYREKADLLRQVNAEIAEVRARFSAQLAGGPAERELGSR